MKKFMTTLVLLCILFVSCKMDYDIIKRDSNLVSISVDISAAKKTSYYVSESFDSTGIKVIAHYTDGTSKEVDIEQVTFDNFSSESPNPALPITVIYQELTTTFNVSIKENEIIKIQVIQTPRKLHYQKDESFDDTGILIMGEDRLQKRTILKPEDYTITNFGYSNVIGNGSMNQLTVSYKNNPDIKDFFYIFFDEWNVDDVRVKEPGKQFYIKGQQKIDLNKLKVEVKINNSNTFNTVRADEYSIEPGDITMLDETGPHNITVWVNDKSASFTINIVDAYVSGIEVDKEFYKNQAFYDGDEIYFWQSFRFWEKLTNTESQINSRGDQITEDYLLTSKSQLQCKYNDIKYDIDDKDSNLTLNGTGVQTLEFEFNFYDIKSDAEKTVTCPIEIYVGASQLESISAEWTKGDKNGYPLGVKPDNSNSEYGSWSIKGKLKNGNEIEIPPESCTFTYNEDPIKEYFENTTKCFDVEVNYSVPGKNEPKKYTTSATVNILEPKQTGIRIEPSDKYDENYCFRDQYEYNYSEYFDVYKTYDVEEAILEDENYSTFKDKLKENNPNFNAIYDKSSLPFGSIYPEPGIIYAQTGDFKDYYNVKFASKRPDNITVELGNVNLPKSESDIYTVDFIYSNDNYQLEANYITITPSINSDKDIEFTLNLKQQCFLDDELKINPISPDSELSCSAEELWVINNKIVPPYQIYRQYSIGENKLKVIVSNYKWKIDEDIIIFTEEETELKCTVHYNNYTQSGGSF